MALFMAINPGVISPRHMRKGDTKMTEPKNVADLLRENGRIVHEVERLELINGGLLDALVDLVDAITTTVGDDRDAIRAAYIAIARAREGGAS